MSVVKIDGGPGLTRLVSDPSQLPGWRPIAVVQEVTSGPVDHYGNDCNYHVMQSTSTITQYLMQQDEERTIRDLQNELRKSCLEHDELAAMVTEAEEKLKQVTEEVERLKREVTGLSEANQRINKRDMERRATIQRLERDAGLVQAEIGKARVREILGNRDWGEDG